VSANWGDLRADLGTRFLVDDVDDDEETIALDERAELGAWPDGLEVRSFADTSLTIPGQSEPPGECGVWGPRQFCNSCADVKLGPHRCQRRICKDCWLTWRAKRAAAVTERLAGARQAASGAEKRLVHAVASPPQPSDATSRSDEVRTLVDWERAKKRAYDLAKEKGIRGGVLIPHGWRVTEEAKETWRELHDAGLVEHGIWKWIREHDRDWRSLTYWSPHFHILGLGADVGANDPDGDDGWVWTRIDSFPRFRIEDPETYKPMLKAASYLLSHVGFETESGKQAIRWFGELANNQFSLEQLADWEQSVIVRTVEEISNETDEKGEGPAADECDCEDCAGTLSPIYEAGVALCDPSWCERIGRDAERRLSRAFEWAIGEIHPPPGMKRPRTETEALEAFETLL
jgi:hypothetical protein